MPFTHISLAEGKPIEYRTALMEEVYLSMREAIGSPENDRFATISEHKQENINNSGNYLGIDRSEDIIFIQITLNHGRSTDQKKALYARIAERLSVNPGVRPQDLVISLSEVDPQNWSLGNGEAQYA
jgi:phenylpyruvate tautomerase PptA (4-oxalocrotonate tautomerase family)